MLIKFDDGVTMDLSGPLRVSCIRGDWFVIGKGMSLPCDSKEEAQETLEEFKAHEES